MGTKESRCIPLDRDAPAGLRLQPCCGVSKQFDGTYHYTNYMVATWLVHLVSSPGSSPGWGHCVVFLGKTPYSHSTSLHPGV